jgi:hypothetical protein
VCGYPIGPALASKDPLSDSITRYYPLSTSGGKYVSDLYEFTGGSCKIYKYFIDNDDDVLTPF